MFCPYIWIRKCQCKTCLTQHRIKYNLCKSIEFINKQNLFYTRCVLAFLYFLKPKYLGGERAGETSLLCCQLSGKSPSQRTRYSLSLPLSRDQMIFSAAYHSTSALSVVVPVADGCEGVALWGVLVDWFNIGCGWLLSRRTGIVPGGEGGGTSLSSGS